MPRTREEAEPNGGLPEPSSEALVLCTRPRWRLDSHFKAQLEQMRDENIISQEQFDKIMGGTEMGDLVEVLKSIPEYERKERKRILNTLSQADQTGSLIWGVLKAVAHICNDIRDAGELIRQGVHELVKIIDSAEFDSQILEMDPHFQSEVEELLSTLYQDSLQFLLESFQFVANRRLTRLLSFFTKSTMQRDDHTTILKSLLGKITSSGEAVIRAAERYHRLESHNHFNMAIANHSEVFQLLRSLRPVLPRTEPGFGLRYLNEAIDWDHHILDGSPSRSFFIGRESEILSIRQFLHSQDRQSAGNRVVISGLRGIGKSHLAHEYAMRYRSEYRMICWIDCSTSSSFISNIDKLIDALRMRDRVDERSTVIRVETLARTLNDTENSWLLILDNCTSETIDDIVNFTPRNHGDVIFTTSDNLVGDQLQDDTGRAENPRPSRIILDDLSPEESIQLLLHGLPEEDIALERLPTARIVEHIRGHPLALKLVRSASQGFPAPTSYEEVLLRIENITGLRNPLRTNTRSLSLDDTIRMSLLKMSSPAQWFLAILACFNNNNIPEILIDSLPFTLVHLATNHPNASQLVNLSDAGQVEDALRENERHGMVRRHTVHRRKRRKVFFSIHPVVSQTTKALYVFHDPGRTALSHAVRVSNFALPSYDEGFLKLEDWQEGEEMLPHAAALELLSREMDFPVEVDGSLQLLYKIACRKYFWRGDQKGAEEIVTAVLGNLDGPLHRRTESEFAFAVLLARMSTTFCLHAKYKSEHLQPWNISFISNVLEDSKRRGNNEGRTTMLKSYLATALSANCPDQVSLDHALELRQEVIKDLNKLHGLSDTRTLYAYARSAFDKASHQCGDLGASDLSVIEDELKFIPPENLRKATHLLYYISRAYSLQNNFVKAKEFGKHALESQRKLVCPSHPHLGWHMLYYIQCLCCLEQWDELARYLQHESLLERFSGPYFEVWTQKVESFMDLYTPEFFNDAVTGDGSILSIAEFVDFRTYWQLEILSRNLLPPDPLYDVAVILDTEDWERAENLVKQCLSYTPNQEVSQPKMLTELLMAQQAIHGLIWAILCRATLCPTEQLKMQTAITAKFGCQTAYREPNQRLIRIWDQIWHQIDSFPCGISIDSDRVPDRYFFIPQLFTPYILRVVAAGEVEATKLVLKRRPNVHIKNSEGKTAFYYAAVNHHFEILQLLLQASEKKPQFYFGETSLLHLLCRTTWQEHHSAEDDQVDAVVALLRRGHKPDFPDGEGRTPLDLAEQHGLREIARELKKFRRWYG